MNLNKQAIRSRKKLHYIKKTQYFIVCILSIWAMESCAVKSSQSTSDSSSSVQAVKGGMWIPNEVDIQDMQRNGLLLNASQLFNNQRNGLNMAIAHFNGGCTSELISPKGLLLTNHHCGYGQIQSHSTLENDYLKEGFWAYDLSEELPNENLTATFVLDIQEVTDWVKKGVNDNMNPTEQLAVIQENISEIKNASSIEDYQNIIVKPYFDGNKYYKILTETYSDVRLVGAPPSSIGKFGSDTDNWVWPRHTGDFSLFRIYAGKDNKPAPYSEDNIPYQPDNYLKVNIGGFDEGDFTMVYGFPGRTQEYLPSEALVNITQITNPAAISVREAALNVMDSKMRKDDDTRIKYASKYARTANYYKKWIGEDLGIEKSGAIAKKKEYESAFQAKIDEKASHFSKYKTILQELNDLHTAQKPYLKDRSLYSEVFQRNSETLLMSYYLMLLQDRKGKDGYEEFKGRVQSALAGIYKNYDSELDLEVTQAIFQVFAKNTDKLGKSWANDSEQNWKKSIVTGKVAVNGHYLNQDIEKVFADDEALHNALKVDPFVNLAREVSEAFDKIIQYPYQEIQREIDEKQKKYMEAQMQVFDDARFFPDANSTLRITYGKIMPYNNLEGEPYPYQTYLSGVMKKYKPGDYEFDVSQKLQDLYAQKDFGRYGQEGKMPVNFIASNHTTGGNSGSPALDKNGNLLGLNFDRVWEGTMSDLYYNPSICRNIMVDTRYIMFIIDKYANAQNLIQEIETIQ